MNCRYSLFKFNRAGDKKKIHFEIKRRLNIINSALQNITYSNFSCLYHANKEKVKCPR